MKSKKYLSAIVEQSLIMILLLIFFNIDKNNHVKITLNFLNVWFILSWICQFRILAKGVPSLRNNSFLQRGAKETQKEHAKHHKKDKWGDNSFANLQHNLTAQKFALLDRSFDTMATFFVRLAYMLFGPIILLIFLVKNQMGKHFRNKRQQF